MRGVKQVIYFPNRLIKIATQKPASLLGTHTTSCLTKTWKTNAIERTDATEKSNAQFLAVGKAYKATLRASPFTVLISQQKIGH